MEDCLTIRKKDIQNRRRSPKKTEERNDTWNTVTPYAGCDGLT